MNNTISRTELSTTEISTTELKTAELTVSEVSANHINVVALKTAMLDSGDSNKNEGDATAKEIPLTEKARTRLGVIQRINAGQLTQKRGAVELGISTRQLRRLQAQYREHGSRALISKRVGKPSNNRLSDAIREQAIFLMTHRYAGEGPTVGHRRLTQDHGLKLSVESLRKIMIENGLWRQRSRQPALTMVTPANTLCSTFGQKVDFRPQV